MTSPFRKDVDCVLERTIDSEIIIEKYQSSFNIDVRHFFNDVPKVSLYRCPVTGYRFYYPFNLSGDGKFYEQLEKYEWYYMPWKWEHTKAKEMIAKGQKVLEIGGGEGGFVERMHKEGFDITGLELNESAAEKARQKGLQVLTERIEVHAQRNHEMYDVVCAFQVLEHIADVYAFLEAAVQCLKKGGKLILCVPNNDSFIKYIEFLEVNLPPHHMGLWNRESLINLQTVFPVSVYEVLYEPLQSYHTKLYKSAWKGHFLFNALTRRVFKFLRGDLFLNFYVNRFSNRIKGHSIMSVYTKNI
jgi:2-polyprenyl-3-methyl-5-hydroxy-6-metoxy-1,4-benzoquinol methylase